MPSLSAIRKKYPNIWIGWVVDERCAGILEGNQYIDEIIVFDRRKVSLSYISQFKKYLRTKNIDVSIDFHGLFKSAALVWLAGAKFKIASASTNGMREFSWLLSKQIKPNYQSDHCVARHLKAVEYLGCETSKVEYNINVSDAQKESLNKKLVDKGIDMSKPIVCIFPGGGWVSRRWFSERFAQVSDKLTVDLCIQVVLIGGKEGGVSEKGINEEIIAQAKHKIFDLTGELTLKELAALLQISKLFVGNEAGPMHLAVAVDMPIVAIIGPTDPKRTGPYAGSKIKIIQHQVSCQPCRNRNCSKRTCMDLITVDEVCFAAKQLMKTCCA
jgi:heptosyltransferase-1